MFLPDNQIAMIVDRGDDFPEPIRRKLESYGSDMWVFRDQPGKATTRALNLYRGELRGCVPQAYPRHLTDHPLGLSI